MVVSASDDCPGLALAISPTRQPQDLPDQWRCYASAFADTDSHLRAEYSYNLAEETQQATGDLAEDGPDVLTPGSQLWKQLCKWGHELSGGSHEQS